MHRLGLVRNKPTMFVQRRTVWRYLVDECMSFVFRLFILPLFLFPIESCIDRFALLVTIRFRYCFDFWLCDESIAVATLDADLDWRTGGGPVLPRELMLSVLTETERWGGDDTEDISLSLSCQNGEAFRNWAKETYQELCHPAKPWLKRLSYLKLPTFIGKSQLSITAITIVTTSKWIYATVTWAKNNLWTQCSPITLKMDQLTLHTASPIWNYPPYHFACNSIDLALCLHRRLPLTESEARDELLLAMLEGDERGDVLLTSVWQSESPSLPTETVGTWPAPVAIDLQLQTEIWISG